MCETNIRDGDMINLKGKNVLVTGGSRGIGAAIARAIASAGGHVLLHYAKSPGAAEKVRDEIGTQNCHLLQADLEHINAPVELWQAATKAAPRIDVLINNAGIFEPVDLEGDMAAWRSAWTRVLQVNLQAPAELCK